ncbi:MAG TPA: divergent polysaccharide deacetylase family protein [Candidatus Aminicenantes bacterium]|nr:divergent polysaccharide deacetylase family protein [Candidatus Aminicenantes bacterium]
MTKRLLPRGRQPWPGFVPVVTALAVAALVSAVLLDHIGARRGGPAYIFAAAARGTAVTAAPARAPAAVPSETPGAGAGKAPTTIEEAVAAGLAAAGVSEDAVLTLKDAGGRPLLEVEIPASLYASIEPGLDKALKAGSIRVAGKKRTKGPGRTEILWSLRRPPREEASVAFLLPAEPAAAAAAGAGEAAAKRGPRGEVALIMDDMGDSLDVLDALIALGRPMTVAVLPYSAHAYETARRARENGLEVLLHVPLESVGNHEDMARTEGMIVAAMTEPAIVAALEAGCDRVPFAAGANNHMGSRFTAERDLMRAVLRPLKERGLFFVDSRTTAKTVAYEEARAMGVPAAQRDVFLDADKDRRMIRPRLIELFQKARKKGRAVGICHPFPETLEVLRSSFGLVEVYNLEAVPVSKLVR